MLVVQSSQAPVSMHQLEESEDQKFKSSNSHPTTSSAFCTVLRIGSLQEAKENEEIDEHVGESNEVLSVSLISSSYHDTQIILEKKRVQVIRARVG